MDFFKYVLFTAHFAVSAALIILVVSQTAKHEGLGSVGGGGGGSESFRGRPGADEQLQKWTRYVAVAFMVLSALVFLVVERWT